MTRTDSLFIFLLFLYPQVTSSVLNMHHSFASHVLLNAYEWGRVYLSSFGTLDSHRTRNSLEHIEMMAVTKQSDTHWSHWARGRHQSRRCCLVCFPAHVIHLGIWVCQIAATLNTMFGPKQPTCVCQSNMSGQNQHYADIKRILMDLNSICGLQSFWLFHQYVNERNMLLQ